MKKSLFIALYNLEKENSHKTPWGYLIYHIVLFIIVIWKAHLLKIDPLLTTALSLFLSIIPHFYHNSYAMNNHHSKYKEMSEDLFHAMMFCRKSYRVYLKALVFYFFLFIIGSYTDTYLLVWFSLGLQFYAFHRAITFAGSLIRGFERE